MKWFRHDGDARCDAKIEKLLMKYGVVGYGLYFYCVEMIAGSLKSDNISFELEHDAEILGYKLHIDTLKVEEIMQYMLEQRLFEISPTTHRITCMSLARRLDNTFSQSLEIKKLLANPDVRAAIDAPKDVEKVEISGGIEKIETSSNFKLLKVNKTRQDKKDIYRSDFEEWWKGYPRKVDKGKAAQTYRARRHEGVRADVLTRARDVYAASVKGKDTKYTLHAKTFLGPEGRWKECLEKPLADIPIEWRSEATVACPNCDYGLIGDSFSCDLCGWQEKADD